MPNEELKNYTGFNIEEDTKEDEHDLVMALLKASSFRSEESVTKVEVKRNGEFLFALKIRPLGDNEVKIARKKATIYTSNPNGKKLPKIKKDFDTSVFHSWLIYLATTEEDKRKIWGNKAILDKFNLLENMESIDYLLTFAEKDKLVDLVGEISGIDDEEAVSLEEYAKN